MSEQPESHLLNQKIGSNSADSTPQKSESDHLPECCEHAWVQRLGPGAQASHVCYVCGEER